MASMSTEPRPIDITDSVELLELVEEVRRSGVELLLKRGEQDLALLVPVTPHQEVQARAGEDRDALLNIIAIGESAEPTDIARDEQEYLAEAYAPARR
jgi:hypothetical protein